MVQEKLNLLHCCFDILSKTYEYNILKVCLVFKLSNCI